MIEGVASLVVVLVNFLPAFLFILSVSLSSESKDEADFAFLASLFVFIFLMEVESSFEAFLPESGKFLLVFSLPALCTFNSGSEKVKTNVLRPSFAFFKL